MILDLEKIREIYGDSSIEELNDNIESLTNNMNYLFKLGFDDVYDTVSLYPYMFLIDEETFKEKVNNLIDSLGFDYLKKLEEDTSLWENVNE